MVGCVEDPPRVVVARLGDLPKQTAEGRPTGLVGIGQRVDVLQHEGTRLRLREDAGVGLQQAGVGVEAGALPLEPEAGLGEGRARRAADEEVRPLPAPKPGRVQQLAGRHREDVLSHDGAVKAGEVLLHGVGSVVVRLACSCDAEAGRLHSEVEPAGAREDRDRHTAVVSHGGSVARGWVRRSHPAAARVEGAGARRRRPAASPAAARATRRDARVCWWPGSGTPIDRSRVPAGCHRIEVAHLPVAAAGRVALHRCTPSTRVTSTPPRSRPTGRSSAHVSSPP